MQPPHLLVGGAHKQRVGGVAKRAVGEVQEAGERLPILRFGVRREELPGVFKDENAVTATLTSKKWRGYYLVTIIDQATGLPLVHILFDASIDEARLGLTAALALLYELWPDCPAERIVGDSAWDEDWANRLCEVEYGLRPIFRLSENRNPQYLFADQDVKISRDAAIKGITHEGQLICAAHNERLEYTRFQRPSRNKDQETVTPGKATNEKEFRVRATCSKGCGTVNFPARHDWSRLTYYPHHANGRPDLHAMREALLDRLGQVESFHNRLKTARKLANEGAARTRPKDKATVQCLIELASLSMAALTVVDQRQQHGGRLLHAVPASGTVKPGEGVGVQDLEDAA